MPDDTSVVYQLRVVLAGISPLIWRRLLIPAQATVADLHTVLQAAFGWSDEHLHRLVVHGVEYGLSRAGAAGFSHDAHQVRLARFGLREGERISYEYDFVDCRRHDIRVEKIAPRAPRHRSPVCVGGARAGPPQDCGGPQAYLALRRRRPLAVVAARMGEILADILHAPDDQAVGELLGEHHEELAGLLLLSRLDDFDRAALNRTLRALALDTEGTPL